MNRQFCERLRAFEEKILANLDKVKCPVHLSLGGEEVSAAISEEIREEDWLFSTHRNHGHYLAKGGSEDRLWDEICGLTTGINQGYAGSQCFSDPAINFHASSIVGGSVGIAVGAAFALRGAGSIVVCCLGDAATEEGVFWESISFASLKSLPILFICENNGLSINVPISERQPNKEGRQTSIWWRVSAFGLATPPDVRTGFKIARSGEPAFVEIETKREGNHCYFPKR